jgi:ATP-dependent RNA helicase DDX10/DBP4
MTSRKVMETDDKSLIKIRFSDLPCSRTTITGLFKSKFVRMTEVQRAAIPHALAGRDLVCCARTGSGKTLAYLIPIIERLYRQRWSTMDGLGALVLVPTRELGI